jgi:signal peptidase II
LISLALIFAGGIGNIIDRLLFEKHVSDFINIGIGDLRTGIFNFADVYVTLGVISFLLFSRQVKPVLNKP